MFEMTIVHSQELFPLENTIKSLISDGRLSLRTRLMSFEADHSFLAIFVECEYCGEIFRGPNAKIIIASCNSHIIEAHKAESTG